MSPPAESPVARLPVARPPVTELNVGYYAHHHGAGHVTRALAIAAAFDGPLTLFGSRLPERVALPNVQLCPLPPDVAAGVEGEAFACLHYAPLGVAGLRERMGLLVDWFRRAWPCLLVVDVSVEVALLARLCGVPTIYLRQRGSRFDAAHELAYASASRLLAPYPDCLEEPGTPAAWRAKTCYAGSLSRYAGHGPDRGREPGTVTVIAGHGGTAFSRARLVAAARACPAWHWTVLGPVLDDAIEAPANLTFLGSVADPAPWLTRAELVVGSAGDSLVAELADLRCRFLCLPDARPFDEQLSTGRLLAAQDLAITCESWPADEDWPGLLARARELDPERWAAVSDGEGARRAAACIRQVAHEVLA
ncbi:Predicted glycosyl transferase [Pseudomonas oryzihabitans]|uniref:Predicted glycosyl transferase n=1 Tax=Pseudomonas oryzihabitans TaxID=47885 RepID=A0A1G5MMQ5_9PSED|nr:hypothetical protein [Pseudomonas psychrotolerans]NMY88006.1 hypothetical protein [Pseudomonas psychrotolerans]SCZ26495.1 Predicted glycosyl transferase [Pseudomonas psychrotolerans]